MCIIIKNTLNTTAGHNIYILQYQGILRIIYVFDALFTRIIIALLYNRVK